MEIKFKKMHDSAVLPTRGSQFSAGLDLYSVEDVMIREGEHKLVNTGLIIQFPESDPKMNNDFAWEAQVRPRSGLALKNKVTVLNAPGTIDQDYTGVIGVILVNHDTKMFHVKQGDRIAQLVIVRVAVPKAVWTETVNQTDRGAGGFGSTGVK